MQVKQVIFDMQLLVTSMLTDMQNHLTVFNLKSADDLLQIKHMIQYVCSLCIVCSKIKFTYLFLVHCRQSTPFLKWWNALV